MTENTMPWLDLQLFADGDTGEIPEAAEPDEDWDLEDEGTDGDYEEPGDYEADEGEEDEDGQEEPPLKGQDPKTNKAFAELRRRAEAAERQAQEATQKVAQFEQQQAQLQTQAQNAQFEKAKGQIAQLKAGLTKYGEQVEQQYLTQNYDPNLAKVMAKQAVLERQGIIRDAEFALDKQKTAATAKAAEEKALVDRYTAKLLADHQDLRTKFGDIVPDLADLDQRIADRLIAGESLKAVWIEENFDRIAELKAKAAAKQGRTQAQSKKHLHGEKSSDIDVDTTAVPPDIYAMYKSVNPKWSDAEIAKDYKTQKRKRK
jgi:hypothetical protein